jgi:hypothetical protein
MVGQYHKLHHDCFFPTHYSHSDPIIQRFTVWVVDSVVKLMKNEWLKDKWRKNKAVAQWWFEQSVLAYGECILNVPALQDLWQWKHE